MPAVSTPHAAPDTVPVVDLSVIGQSRGTETAAALLDAACRDTGFFCIVGHGIDPALLARMDAAARQFFALPEPTKSQIAMAAGGRAWRGWFPLGVEVTSGIPDGKEGIYFGEELGPDDARVAAGLPLHGANLFPPAVPELRASVLAWIEALTKLGHVLMSLIAQGLGLPADAFRRDLTADPTVLFRIFRYPDAAAAEAAGLGIGEWGVAEHTDYGLLTMLAQDDRGGLQVRGHNGWMDVAPIENSFVCNIGDMLERMTGGRYRSTPHRVRNTSGSDRLSFPFFFDPSWDAHVTPLPLAVEPGDSDGGYGGRDRWDGRSVFEFDGTYGEYLVAKVSKVFPNLVHVI